MTARRPSMGRRARANGLEQDVTGKWSRRNYAYVRRTGFRGAVKTIIRRRERRTARQRGVWEE